LWGRNRRVVVIEGRIPEGGEGICRGESVDRREEEKEKGWTEKLLSEKKLLGFFLGKRGGRVENTQSERGVHR